MRERIRRLAWRLLSHGAGIFPGGRERVQRLRQARRQRLRRRAFDSHFRPQDGGLATRSYDSYNAYLQHQTARLGEIKDRLQESESGHFAAFLANFRDCPFLVGARDVLCLGARLGTEVRALRALGHFAVGIDLNPGDRNAYVLNGDFQRLEFADGSVDAVFTNALDHAYDLSTVIAEVVRVLRPGGVFVLDVVRGYQEGFQIGAYEALHWSTAEAIIARVRELGGFELLGTRSLDQIGAPDWLQAGLRKPG